MTAAAQTGKPQVGLYPDGLKSVLESHRIGHHDITGSGHVGHHGTLGSGHVGHHDRLYAFLRRHFYLP